MKFSDRESAALFDAPPSGNPHLDRARGGHSEAVLRWQEAAERAARCSRLTREQLIEAGLLTPARGPEPVPVRAAVEAPVMPARVACAECGSTDYPRSRVRRDRILCATCARGAR